MCVALGVVLILSGTLVSHRQHAERAAYDELGHALIVSDKKGSQADAPADEGRIDWESLQTQNDEVVAWVSVEGIDLSLPVVAPRDQDMAYYLTHDFWRNDSYEGTPFLDHRCVADGCHRLTYGHHLTAGGQFSDLQRVWVQEEFDRLGTCHWLTPGAGATQLVPLCAARVDLWYAGIQQFDFSGKDGLRTWLAMLVERSSATSPQAQQLVRNAKSVVTLVTCASDIGNQEWRTIMTFVET